jgi:fumarate reductase iron-sulfur subunit
MPLPVFKLVGDLCVDTGSWFRRLNEELGAWIHTDKEFDPEADDAPTRALLSWLGFLLEEAVVAASADLGDA